MHGSLQRLNNEVQISRCMRPHNSLSVCPLNHWQKLRQGVPCDWSPVSCQFYLIRVFCWGVQFIVFSIMWGPLTRNVHLPRQANSGKINFVKICSRTFYPPFLSHQEVEPMAKESDHIHIIALTDALGVCVRVVYMDRGGDSSVNLHDFPEDGSTPLVTLLYRPGHYDILYQKQLWHRFLAKKLFFINWKNWNGSFL